MRMQMSFFKMAPSLTHSKHIGREALIWFDETIQCALLNIANIKWNKSITELNMYVTVNNTYSTISTWYYIISDGNIYSITDPIYFYFRRKSQKGTVKFIFDQSSNTWSSFIGQSSGWIFGAIHSQIDSLFLSPISGTFCVLRAIKRRISNEVFTSIAYHKFKLKHCTFSVCRT